MDWGEMAALAGTLVATGVAGLALVWRMLESVRRDLGREIEKVRREVEGVRQEGREAHAKIGEQIAGQRDGLQADIAEVGRELAGVRDELKGVTRSVDTLRQDFRAHVMAA